MCCLGHARRKIDGNQASKSQVSQKGPYRCQRLLSTAVALSMRIAPNKRDDICADEFIEANRSITESSAEESGNRSEVACWCGRPHSLIVQQVRAEGLLCAFTLIER